MFLSCSTMTFFNPTNHGTHTHTEMLGPVATRQFLGSGLHRPILGRRILLSHNFPWIFKGPTGPPPLSHSPKKNKVILCRDNDGYTGVMSHYQPKQCWLLIAQKIRNLTVDGRNPKQPPGMYKTLFFFWNIYHINWRRISAINRMTPVSLQLLFVGRNFLDLGTWAPPLKIPQPGDSK